MKNIRYTKGPDEVGLGDVKFKRGEAQPISDELAAQALLPERVAAFGFEEVRVQTSAPAAAKKNEALTDTKE